MAFPLMSEDGDVKWRGTQVAHARGWSISLSNSSQTYTTNNTNGLVNRRPGNTDATGSFTVKRSTTALPFMVGQIAELQLMVTAAAGWTITNALIASIDEEVDIETNAVIGYTVNWEFAGSDSSGGSIAAPDGALVNKTTTGEVSES